MLLERVHIPLRPEKTNDRAEEPTRLAVCGVLVWRLKFGSVVSGRDRNTERRIHDRVRRSLIEHSSIRQHFRRIRGSS